MGQLNCCQKENQGLFQTGCSDPQPGKEPGSTGSFIPAENHPFSSLHWTSGNWGPTPRHDPAGQFVLNPELPHSQPLGSHRAPQHDLYFFFSYI